MKSYPLLLLFAFVLIVGNCFGQITFQKTFGAGGNDIPQCVQQTHDGGYIIAGYTTSGGSGNNQGLLMKTDSNGNLLWNKIYWGNSDKRATWVQQTSDSGYIIICGFGFLIKTDKYGDTTWTRSYSSVGTFNYVEQTSDGGYIACGTLTTTVVFGAVIRLDSYGNVLWSINNGPSSFITGSTAGFNEVHQTTDGGYITAGYIFDGNTNTVQSYLLKLNSAGAVVWGKDYWIGDIGAMSKIYSVRQTADLGYVFAGYTDPSNNQYGQAIIVKTDNLGNINWQKIYSNAGGARAVIQTKDGGYVAALQPLQNSQESLSVLKIDTGGNYQWGKKYQLPSNTASVSWIQQAKDRGFIIAGVNIAAAQDVYLIKTDSNGVSNCNETSVLLSSSNTSYTVGQPTESNYSLNTVTGYFNVQITSLSYTTTVACDSDGTTTTTGMRELQNNSLFSIYPNPTGGQFTISLPMENSEIVITNLLGQQIMKTVTIQPTMDLHIDLNGVYIVSVKTNKGVKGFKLVVNH